MEWDPIIGQWREITRVDESHGASSSSHDDDELVRRNRILVATAAACSAYYTEYYLVKEPCRTSALTGSMWIQELEEGNATRIYESFRMHRGVFFNLCTLLETYGLYPSRNVGVREQVAIFLFIVGQSSSNRNAQERFQHSGETINHYFHAVLNACIAMAMDWVRPTARNGVHPYVRRSNKYYPFFKDCIGAIDGTHIKANVAPHLVARFIGRKGYPTQNIMAVCDFDLCFTFALPGWEGSAHDTRVFLDCIRNQANNFPYPEGDEFYLVDAGYPNRKGYLAPYKGHRYHIPEWENAPEPRSKQEKFNKVHSSLRSAIERSFGIWKARWPLLKDIPVGYTFNTQKKLVLATMAIHNFIRRSGLNDIPFDSYDADPDFVPEDEEIQGLDRRTLHGTPQPDEYDMGVRRAAIAQAICSRHA